MISAYKNEPSIIDLLTNIGELNESNLKLPMAKLRIYSNREILKISSQWASHIIQSIDDDFFNSSQNQGFALKSATAEIAKIEVETISILAALEAKEEHGDRMIQDYQIDDHEIIYDDEFDQELSNLEKIEKNLTEELSEIDILCNTQIIIRHFEKIHESGNKQGINLAQ